MKSRVGASISPLFNGQHKSSIFKAISVIPKFTLFNCDGHSNSLQLQGIESLKRSVHSSADEDDEFSELGPPVAQGVSTMLKLVTEKPEPFRKTDLARKVFPGRSLPGESSLSLRDIFSNMGRPSPTPQIKLENHNDVSGFSVNSNSASNFKNSRSITIENIPSIVDLSQLIEAISIFGKISSVSMRTVPNEFDCCDVLFESAESSSRAISKGRITVRRFQLPIRPLHVPETVTIRIKNISSETTDPAIHSMCTSIGSLEGLARAKKDAVDAFYRVKDDLGSQSILKKLNDTVIDDCQWSAHLLPRDFTPVVMTNNEDAKYKLGLQISSDLAELRRDIYMKKNYSEDLEWLHLAIVHLESGPTGSNTSLID
uniref:RRM domain-containing protein n=1 Tax=Davidia involucrata TaxID=16924 RepID=A0A5B7BG13_DAVIN